MSNNIRVLLTATLMTAFSACAANPAEQGTDPTIIETASATLTGLPAGVIAHVTQVGADEVVTFSNTDTSSVAARDAEAPIPQVITPRFSVVLSFLNSCQVDGSRVTIRSDGAVTFASSPACLRRSGPPSQNPFWPPFPPAVCTTNVSNCNGSIVCQNHCP